MVKVARLEKYFKQLYKLRPHGPRLGNFDSDDEEIRAKAESEVRKHGDKWITNELNKIGEENIISVTCLKSDLKLNHMGGHYAEREYILLYEFFVVFKEKGD